MKIKAVMDSLKAFNYLRCQRCKGSFWAVKMSFESRLMIYVQISKYDKCRHKPRSFSETWILLMWQLLSGQKHRCTHKRDIKVSVQCHFSILTLLTNERLIKRTTQNFHISSLTVEKKCALLCFSWQITTIEIF